MVKTNCYLPIKGIDDVFAKRYEEISNKKISIGEVAGYRTLYEEKYNTQFSIEDFDKLKAFIINASKEEVQKAKDRARVTKSSRTAFIYKHLNKVFGPLVIRERIKVIAGLFSARVNDYADDYPRLSREEIIRRVGFSNLMADVREIIEDSYSEAVEEQDSYKIDEFKKILDNWDALVFRAQPEIKTTESVILGQNFDFVVDADESNFNDLESIGSISLEESVREHWQTHTDFVSSFGLLSKEVRRTISRTFKRKGEEYDLDDLGLPKFLSAQEVHRTLQELSRGVTSSRQMMERLENYSKNNSWLSELYQELYDKPILRTQFFVDLYTNFQIYSIQYTDSKGVLKTKILNRSNKDRLYNEYSGNILVNSITGNSIFNYLGSGIIGLHKNKIEDFISKVDRAFKEPEEKDFLDYEKDLVKYNEEVKEYNKSLLKPLFSSKKPIKPKKPTTPFKGYKKEEQIAVMADLLSYLNIPVNVDHLEILLSNTRDVNVIINNIQDLVKYSLAGIKNFNMTADNLYNSEVYKEKVQKILEVLAKYGKGIALDSRVRHDNKTRYSNVTPSYMGDFFNFIENCATNEDENSLVEFLKNKYLGSELFLYEGEVLNTWIKELLDSESMEEGGFAYHTTWKRGLSLDNIDFENLSANKHIQYLLNEFFSEREISKKNIEYISKEDFKKLEHKDPSKLYYIEGTNKAYKFQSGQSKDKQWKEIQRNDYAWYPTFILGDANIAKFIKARIYSASEILEGMYNIYVSEKRRQVNTNEIEEFWKQNNISPNKNLIKNKDSFTMLPFLNADYKTSKYYNIALKGGWSKSAVKSAIREYLTDSAKEFEEDLLKRKIISEGSSRNMQEYFWNTSFATLQQLQLMTIDVAFYDSIKDLQKRYKEIHAPGSILDIDAIDPWTGDKVSDGIERAVYFKEVKTNTEDTDPKFMRVLKKVFGENSRILDLYRRNKSTDGQSYRTLSSYRKVMIMAGKWNNDFEDAYNMIQSIRDLMKAEGRDTPDEEEMRKLDELSVTFQPIKPYLFGHEKVNGTTIPFPVQHKCAEAVLIPELLPKNSSLREMANYLENNNIDIACSTEVVKVGEYGSVDISKGSIADNLSKAVVHKLSYKDYRIQTNVPNHVWQSRLFGTQFRKLIMSGLKRNDYSDYTDGNLVTIIPGKEPEFMSRNGIIKFYNSLIVANILDSYKLFTQVAGDKYKLSESAIFQIINNEREIKDNIEAMSINEFGEFVSPLFEGGIEHDAAAMLFSIYKKIVNKQSILGGSAVQVSEFGITKNEEGENLQFVTDGEDNILYAECEIPFNFSYTNYKGQQVQLKFSDYCNPDGSFKKGSKENTTKIEEEFPGILDIIAYRIPTERAYSMMNLKVVRCSHPLAGGTIKVPAQGVTIAGFDFDVDKLYFMRNEFIQKSKHSNLKLSESDKNSIWTRVYENHPDIMAALEFQRELDGYTSEDEKAPALNSYWNESTISQLYDKEDIFEEAAEELGITIQSSDTYWETYDYSKSPFEQSVSVRNNMILHLSRKRLMDKETLKDRYTPGGFFNASRAARTMRELIYSNWKSLVSGKQLNYKELVSNIDYDDLESDPEPKYDPSNPMTIITYNQQNQVASKLIGIFANHNAHHSFISSLGRCELGLSISFGNHIADGGLKDLLNAPVDSDTFLMMAEFLAASVDAVKDPVLNFLNLNTITADSGALLARLGYSMEEIGLLFNQPSIIRLCQYCFDNGISDISEALRVIASEYGIKDLTKVESVPSLLSMNNLSYNIYADSEIGKNQNLEVDTKVQIQALKAFYQIQNAASELSKFILNTKFTAANSVSSTFGEAYEKQMALENYVKGFKENKVLTIEVNSYKDLPISDSFSEVFGSNEYLEHILRNPLAFEQAMCDANNACLSYFKTLVPYDTQEYKEVRNILAKNFTKSGKIDADIINEVHREIPVYLLQNDENSLLNPSKIRDDESIVSYTLKDFPKFIAEIKAKEDPNYAKYSFDDYFELVSEEGSLKVIPQDTGGISPEQIDVIRAEINDLNETHGFGEDLFYYSFFTSGFNFNHLSFINLIPTKVKETIVVAKGYNGENITYYQYLRNIKDGNGHSLINPADFCLKYALNHPNNDKIVYKPKGKIKGVIEKLSTGQSEFTIKETEAGRSINSLIVGVTDDTIYFRPVLNINGRLFVANGNGPLRNESVVKSITYREVRPLGDGVSIFYSDIDVSKVKEEAIIPVTDNGNTGIIPEEQAQTDEEKESIVNEIFEHLIKQMYELSEETVDKNKLKRTEEILREEFNVKSLEEKIAEIKERVKAIAPQFRDSEGNLTCNNRTIKN